MQWWKIALIVVGAVALGLAAGYLLNFLIVRITSALRKPRGQAAQGPAQPANQSTPEPPPSVPDLLAEIEYNRRLATSQWSGQLQAFQTKAWDNRGDELHALPADIRDELAEAYSDMALANSITWLSTEMSRRSSSLDDSYTKLRVSVGARLNRINALMGDSASTTTGPTQ